MALTLGDIVAATGGRLLKGSAEHEVRGISTDSRSVRSGDLFFAIRGKKHDGHRFVSAALDNGACGAVVEVFIDDVYRDIYREQAGRDQAVGGDRRRNSNIVVVGDTLRALGDLASFIRKRHGVPLVAVGGSSGKTTTKEMIASILSRSMDVLKTPGNMNNLVGLPLTLAALKSSHEVCVVELGISEPGEMKRLAAICRPDIAVITNIGTAHLEGFGSVERIRSEKMELYSSLRPGGVRVVNIDEPWVSVLMDDEGIESVTFGRTGGADVVIKDFSTEETDGISVDYEVRGRRIRVRFRSPLFSNTYNGAASIAAVLPLETDIVDIREGLEAFSPPGGRMEVIRAGEWTILDDTYNANPDSVVAALKTLGAAKGRKVAVLGDMLELGELTLDAHRDIGEFAAGSGIDLLIAVGRWAEVVGDGAVTAGMGKDRVYSFEGNEETLDALRSLLKEGDTVLVKGSRSTRMEEVVEGLIRSKRRR